MGSDSYYPHEDGLLAERKLLIGSPIDDQSATTTIAKLLYLNKQEPNAPITLYIDSIGGSATASLAIIDTITEVHAPIHTRSNRFCQGSAFLILAVGRRGQRYATADTILSIERTILRSPDPENRALFYLDSLNERMARTFSAHSRLTHKLALEALTKGRQFTAAEALAAGIVDFITEPENDKH